MGEPAMKLEFSTVESDQGFPIYTLFTRVLIQALCPVFKSELVFGDLQPLGPQHRFGFFCSQKIEGDLEGVLSVAAEPSALRHLALGIQLRNGSEPDLEGTIIKLQSALSQSLAKQFEKEEFRCHIESAQGVKRDHVVTEMPPESFVCPVETKCGAFLVIFSLRPVAPSLREEFSDRDVQYESRKIRVFASQLDSLFDDIKGLETLETKLLTGPHIRAQMRSQIKKLKRLVHQLKSEPLEMLFSPARKLVTEIAKQQGKQISITTKGTWLYLDKTILNHLYEPILHLIRNAVDHGIEETADRERVGKPAQGSIKCLATFGEKGLRMLVSDDGQGLDFAKIRARAVAKGLFTAEQAERKLPQDLSQLVFEAGFSTRDRADAISGRGLGLEIVRRGIESISGTIRILSTSNHGTSFEICVPLSEDFLALSKAPRVQANSSKEAEERTVLLDELAGFLDRLRRNVQILESERALSAAYESYRLIHSIKGTAGFLGWNRVVSFCHHFEDLLKIVAEEKTGLDDICLSTIKNATSHLKEFCEVSRSEASYSLFEIRKLESRILQLVWSATHSDERTHFYFGKYHLSTVEKMLLRGSGGDLKAKAEVDFAKAMEQPYGALVQFSGDRRGYAGILMPESTVMELIHPYVTGSKEKVPVKTQLWTLTEFATLMGGQLSELAQKSEIQLHPAAPLTYFGWGQPLKILGNPTYCYACEYKGLPFYLAGDFRTPQEMVERFTPTADLKYNPSVIVKEALNQCQAHFKQWKIPVTMQEVASQSELIGFDGGVTAIISCVSPDTNAPSGVLFLSYESGLADHIYKQFTGTQAKITGTETDLYDCLAETSNEIGGRLVTELEKQKIRMDLSLPTVFIGKAYLANFNRLFMTNKIVGNTEKGRFEMQLLVTQLAH